MDRSRGKKPIIAIVGTNASGKSSLAIAIARKFNGEIISADSRQVYKGLDLGSGKVSKAEQRMAKHHLIDVASPVREYSVAHFVKDAKKKIIQIQKNGGLPIICGGTGFWVDTLCRDTVFPNVPPNAQLRNKLKKLPAEKLFAKLKKLDPTRARTIDRHNPYRLIRALEIIIETKKSIPKLRMSSPYSVLWIGIQHPKEELWKKIHQRLHERIKRGLIKEVRTLHNRGISWKRLEALGLEYRYVGFYLQGKMQKTEMIEQLEKAIRHYAKRQKTWFKRNKDIHWIHNKLFAYQLVKKWLENQPPAKGASKK